MHLRATRCNPFKSLEPITLFVQVTLTLLNLKWVIVFFIIVSKVFNVWLFVADVGGYLGLLIGGSCLTVIEVVDLIFYNAVLKCCARR